MAHAYYPRDGRAHFDEDETYTHDTKYGVNLLWVATHEFGHSLGLDHTNVQGAIMYPYYTGYVPDMKLHSDDIAGIQYLYGKNYDDQRFHTRIVLFSNSNDQGFSTLAIHRKLFFSYGQNGSASTKSNNHTLYDSNNNNNNKSF